MYQPLLILHSLVRWVVVLAGLTAAVLLVLGWLQKKDWTPLHARLSLIFTISLDVQVLLGLLLYLFFSPLTQIAFSDFGLAMSDRSLRFYAVEHIFMMIVALALAHVGSALAKKAPTSAAKFQRVVIFFGLALLAILAGIPWDRPFFRLG